MQAHFIVEHAISILTDGVGYSVIHGTESSRPFGSVKIAIDFAVKSAKRALLKDRDCEGSVTFSFYAGRGYGLVNAYDSFDVVEFTSSIKKELNLKAKEFYGAIK